MDFSRPPQSGGRSRASAYIFFGKPGDREARHLRHVGTGGNAGFPFFPLAAAETEDRFCRRRFPTENRSRRGKTPPLFVCGLPEPPGKRVRSREPALRLSQMGEAESAKEGPVPMTCRTGGTCGREIPRFFP